MYFGRPFGGLIPGAWGGVLAALLRTGTPMTGRQIHGLVSDEHSLWSVQQVLKGLIRLGLVETQTAGRARLHTINEGHIWIPHLRALADPIVALKHVIEATVGNQVDAVIVFGSLARGEARIDGDIDLAIIAGRGWDGHVALHDAIDTRLGNTCDVLVFTATEFSELARAGEPVVGDILRDGVALLGSKPRVQVGAAQ